MSYKSLIKMLILAIIDFILIWFWIGTMNLDGSSAIGIIAIIPIIIILNLVISGILYLFKKKELSFLFLMNSIIASVITYFIFSYGIRKSIEEDSKNYQTEQTIQN